MKDYFLKMITHPAVHYNTITIGILITIGALHNHAHFTMDKDVNAYVRQWCRSSAENKKICISYGSNDY
jgi:hypothetical protein